MNKYSFLGLVTEQWEIIYYVAFILLTIGIAFFTAKTYYFQAKKTSELFCKSVEKEANKGNSNLYIEIYNYGNEIAKDISVNIQEIDFGVIPFLKPLESYLIPTAYFIHASDKKIIFSEQIKLKNDTDVVNVKISVGKNIKKYEVNIRIQESSSKLSEIDTRAQDKIAKNLEEIGKQQEKTTAELKKIGDKIKK